MKVEILKGALKITSGERSLHVAAHPDPDAEDNTLVVALDSIATWDPPGEGPDVTIEDLQKMTEAIERACGRFGIAVEFE